MGHAQCTVDGVEAPGVARSRAAVWVGASSARDPRHSSSVWSGPIAP